MFEHLLIKWVAYLTLSILLVSFSRAYWRLRHIPGPALAGWTDLWRLINVLGRRAETTQLNLHATHGDVVRLGPNCVSVQIPDIVDTIYGIGKGFDKSDFYIVWHNMVNNRRVSSPVFETNETQHAHQKRPIASSYQLSKLMEFESFVDSTTAAFFQRLDQAFVAPARDCDLGAWLQFYAFDVIGELTFSKRLGFLARGGDVEGIIAAIARNFGRCSVLGQMPWLDEVTWKNPVYTRFFAKAVVSPIMKFGQRRMLERVNPEMLQEEQGDDIEFTDPELRAKALDASGHTKGDFLSRFLASREESPDAVTDKQILAYLFMNINAGSDTIASTLRAVFYYLLKNPTTLSTLRSELDDATSKGRILSPFVTWTEAQTLPYLGAVIKEALRLHPALSLTLERIVPAAGLQLPNKNATFLPPGTVVGTNPWVLHRDVRVFGEDAAQWRPERWLNEDQELMKKMERNMLAFGAGKRSCMGKNIAMLEMYKIVPALLLRYDMQLTEPQKEWRLHNSWLITQTGLNVKLSKRN